MRLNYNDMLLLAIWEYNRRQDEDLTLELFQEIFGQVPGAHFHDKWVHYYNKNLLMMVAYFRVRKKTARNSVIWSPDRLNAIHLISEKELREVGLPHGYKGNIT